MSKGLTFGPSIILCGNGPQIAKRLIASAKPVKTLEIATNV
jgi:hypothetical protein